MPINHKIILTIYPEFGGAYDWLITNGDESQGLGGGDADTSRCWWNENPISDGLQAKFEDWQSLFERDVSIWGVDTEFDWKSFHERGLQLTFWLKQEIGDAARVVYEKPFEDPDKFIDERREIMLDGTTIPLPGRLEVFCIRLSRYIEEIISGGQTGANRAALDWALARALPHSGWCPAGRRAEDGIIDARYALKELPGGYDQCTRKNVEDSDGTLILHFGKIDGIALEIQRFAKRLKKSCLAVRMDVELEKDLRLKAIRWLRANEVKRLNIVGPRESKRPGIYKAVSAYLDFLDQGYDPPRA